MQCRRQWVPRTGNGPLATDATLVLLFDNKSTLNIEKINGKLNDSGWIPLARYHGTLVVILNFKKFLTISVEN